MHVVPEGHAGVPVAVSHFTPQLLQLVAVVMAVSHPSRSGAAVALQSAKPELHA
jgi:hypothetical protein